MKITPIRRPGTVSNGFIDPKLDANTLNALKEALDAEMFLELVNMYIVDSQENFNKLLNAIEMSDQGNAIMAAHSIKGSSGNVGAQTAFEVSRDMEAQAKAGDFAAISQNMSHLQNVITATCEGMKTFAG